MNKNQRLLRYESLEARELFSVDAIPHNFLIPEDCDNSGEVSPLDALVLINQLNQAESSSATKSGMMLDVDADGSLSPLDALVVINHLNRQLPDGSPTPSSVPIDARIARLQSAIANATLPPSLSLDDAKAVLDTLCAGGRPEMGERLINGQLHPKVEVDKIENERATIDLIAPEGDQKSRLQLFVDRFASRLKSAGVDAKVITTISQEIIAGFEAKTPLTLEQIKSRLTDLGVDVSKIFPTIPTNPKPPIEHPNLDRGLAKLVARLKDAGVNATVVTTIVGEIKTSIDAGTPLTLEQIKTRLTELGVDVSKIFPIVPPDKGHDHPIQLTPPIELVTGILTRAKVPADKVEAVRKAMIAAKEAGSPLTVSQLLKLLNDQGVQIPELLSRLLRGISAR